MKRFLRLLLCLTLTVITFAIILVSCNGSKQENQSDGNESFTQPPDGIADTGTTQEVSDANPRLAVSDDLPVKDYNGDQFNILYLDWSSYQLYQFASEEIGEVMNDAIYYRQKHVEDRFNIKIEPIKINYGDMLKSVSNAVKSGSHAYDLLLTHTSFELVGIMTGNYILNWNTVPTVDFSKPWWNQDAIDTLTMDGKLYYAMSDFIIPEPNAVFFNKNMVADYNLENPYALVREGKWTIDKLYEMAKSVSKDVNGDGEWTDEDQYGLVTQFDWYFRSIAQSCGMKCVGKGDDGRPAITVDAGKMQSILEKYNALINDKTITFTYKYGAMGDQYISALPLSTGRVLFHFDPLPQAVKYRGNNIDYGILPWPKYDETQKKYAYMSWNGFMAIPSTVPDLEKEGIIVEALSAESYKYCVPAFYDVLMNIKLTRDEDSVEMLNIIYDGCVYDLDVIYDISIGNLTPLLLKKSVEYVSFYEKSVAASQKKLDNIYAKVEALD